jgi:hypothetical protein
MVPCCKLIKLKYNQRKSTKDVIRLLGNARESNTKEQHYVLAINSSGVDCYCMPLRTNEAHRKTLASTVMTVAIKYQGRFAGWRKNCN